MDAHRCFLSSRYSSFFLSPTNESEIKLIINNIDIDKATGVDSIPAKIINLSSELLSPILTYIFNFSFEKGEFPSKLKYGKIIPSHKKGDKDKVSNYRPITILPIFSKILERLMFNRLNNYISTNSILSERQFGFQKGKSTSDAITTFVSDIYSAINNNEYPVGMCYDFAKAFDSVCHKILIKKMESYGIRGIPLEWFKSYLKNRQVCIVNRDSAGNEFISNFYTVNVGVPQGSVLGPLLFLLFINDITTLDHNVNFTLFADDSNIALKSSDINDIPNILSSLNSKMLKWSDSNGLKLNVDKTSTVIFKNYSNTEFLNVELSNSTKFLGVIIDNCLSWKNHVEYVCGKVTKIIPYIRKMKNIMTREHLLMLYNTLIFPHFNYGVTIWGHCSADKVKRLLKLQKWILRIITNKRKTDSCRNLFSEFNMLTFPSIYIFFVSIYIFKQIKNGLIQLNCNIHTFNTRNKNNVYTDYQRLTKTQNNPKFIGAIIFNKLPDNIKNSISLNVFKKNLKCIYSYDEFFDLS